MLGLEGTKEYWKDQTEKGDNPCHYHNYWQDRYAYEVRTGALKKSDFADAKEIVDIGCGVGEYTRYVAGLTKAHITGFDFPFNIKLAQKTDNLGGRLTYIDDALPSERVATAIRAADVIYTTTVYVHLPPEARTMLLEASSQMKKGSKVILLEYIPDEVPEFQKGLPHKEVETVSEIASKFEKVGFELSEIRPVNYVDSYFFFRFGKNGFSYALTRVGDFLLSLVRAKGSKYKVLIFTHT